MPRKKAVTAVPVKPPDPPLEGTVVQGPVAEAKMMMAAKELINPWDVVEQLTRYVHMNPNIDDEVDRDTERSAILTAQAWRESGRNDVVLETLQRARWGLPERRVETAAETTGWVPKVPVSVVVQTSEYQGLQTAEQAWAQARAEGWVDWKDDDENGQQH
jgi:hypothetical protein